MWPLAHHHWNDPHDTSATTRHNDDTAKRAAALQWHDCSTGNSMRLLATNQRSDTSSTSTSNSAMRFRPVRHSHDRSSPIKSAATTTDRRSIWGRLSQTSSHGDDQRTIPVVCCIPPGSESQLPLQSISSASIPIRIGRPSFRFDREPSSADAFGSHEAAAAKEDLQTNGQLARMYDQRTWDMYMLITNARRARVPHDTMIVSASTRDCVSHVRHDVHVVYDEDDEESSISSSRTSEEDLVFDLED